MVFDRNVVGSGDYVIYLDVFFDMFMVILGVEVVFIVWINVGCYEEYVGLE